MTRVRWALSLLILFHITAISLATIPPPSELNAVGPVRDGVEGDAVARALTPIFDRTAAAVWRVEPVLYDLTAPVRRITQPYVSAGVRQNWRMFADPPTEDRYVRLRYYLDPGPSSQVPTVAELVLPVDRDEWLRYFRGKAIRNAVEAYVRREYREIPLGSEDESADGSLYRDLVPLVRYFRTRFQRTHAGGQTIARTDLWFGMAPIPPPGQRLAPDVLARRDAILAGYRGRPTSAVSRFAFPVRGSVEREADIVWRLEFIDTSNEAP